jgi:F-type H+-transporting ATPase subunit a
MILAEVEPAPVSHPTFEVGGCGNWCTFNSDSLISSGLAIVITIAFAIVVARMLNPSRPGRLQGIMEWLFGYVRRNVSENSPDAASFVVPLAATIGFYILVANWLDFLPITIVQNLHPANTDLNQTLAMAIVVFLLLQWYNVRLRGWKGYFRYFVGDRPHGMSLPWRIAFVPLNLIEEIVKPLTLSMRLFGNIFAGLLMGYVIVLILGGIPGVGTWLLGPAFLAAWKLFDVGFIGLIQALIFMLLTIIYFGLAREGLEAEHAH